MTPAQVALEALRPYFDTTAELQEEHAVVQGIARLIIAEREALARMIEHKPDAWWGSGSVANSVRNGEKCHPECEMCELEKSE